MPALKSPRKERFAQLIVEGMKPEAAYEEAGYKPHAQNAHRMMKNDDVRERIAELRAPIIEAVQWDYQARLEMLRDTALQAFKDKNHKAVVSAISESNRMEGSYRPTVKEIAEVDVGVQLAAMLKTVIDAKPALPIGRPQLRVVNE